MAAIKASEMRVAILELNPRTPRESTPLRLHACALGERGAGNGRGRRTRRIRKKGRRKEGEEEKEKEKKKTKKGKRGREG